MKLFSQRKGIKPVKSAMQVNSMDKELRNGLWNALTIFYWEQVRSEWLYNSENERINTLFRKLWIDYFKRQIDTLEYYWPKTYKETRKYFFNCKWHEVYDFIEFIANNYTNDYNEVTPKFIDFCNYIFERELSAYRFVGGNITQITKKEEILEMEKALENSNPLKAVNTHLKRALDLLSDRKYPDYRNSIKEAISAVEAICNLITEEKKASLWQALKKIENKISLHPALKNAFKSLYGYTSNAEGIRHALLNEPNLGFEDAKFMLVSCSAFINYLIIKMSKAGIKI